MEERKTQQFVFVALVQQIKIGCKKENIAIYILRELQFVRLPRCHKENAGRLYLVLVAIDNMKARSATQEQYLVKIVAVRVLHLEMATCVEHLHLEFLVWTGGRTEIIEPVNGDIIGSLCQCFEILNAKARRRKEY